MGNIWSLRTKLIQRQKNYNCTLIESKLIDGVIHLLDKSMSLTRCPDCIVIDTSIRTYLRFRNIVLQSKCVLKDGNGKTYLYFLVYEQ